MLIPEELLLSYGAECVDFNPGDQLFSEGHYPRYYFQVKTGWVKLNHYNEDGKELILGLLDDGLSVCELLLFIDRKYPVNAVAVEVSTVLLLPKEQFHRLIDENLHISKDINRFLSERLYYKFLMLENNVSLHASVRIKGIIDYLKSFSNTQEKFSFEVPLTRQQIAASTGLRVETVIRTVKELERLEQLRIENGKIYY